MFYKQDIGPELLGCYARLIIFTLENIAIAKLPKVLSFGQFFYQIL